MRTDKKIIDAQLSAIEILKHEFLKFIHDSRWALSSKDEEENLTPEQIKAVNTKAGEWRDRNNRIMDALKKCDGSMDEYWIGRLFYELEQCAIEEFNKAVLLGQTTEPDALKKHFPDLNEQLIDNVKNVQKHLADTGLSKKGVEGLKDKKEKYLIEIIYRANWFLENPEPEYRNNVENYRSSTLAKIIEREWSKPGPGCEKKYPKPELWKNETNLNKISIKSIGVYITEGVKDGKLPDFLLEGKPVWKK